MIGQRSYSMHYSCRIIPGSCQIFLGVYFFGVVGQAGVTEQYRRGELFLLLIEVLRPYPNCLRFEAIDDFRERC